MDDYDCSHFELPTFEEKQPESKVPVEEEVEWEVEKEVMDSEAEEKTRRQPLFLKGDTDPLDDDGTAMDDWDCSDFELPPFEDKPLESKIPVEEEYGNVEWEVEREVMDSKAEEARPQLPFLEGETDAPDVEKLSQVLCGADLIKPSSLLVRSWICSDCWTIHHGSINYFANIQDYECLKCLIKNPVAYEWTLTRCFLNGISLDFRRVENQLTEPTCILYAFLSLCDLCRRIRGAKRQCEEATLFDHYFMHMRFAQVSGYRLDNESMHTNGYRAIESMLITAYRHGVPYSSTFYDREKLVKKLPSSCKDTRPPRRSLKVSSWFRVRVKEVEKITRLIGHGIPLLAVVPAGKCFEFLSGDEVYPAPDPDGCVRHAVVLHGSGVAMPKSAIRKTQPGEPIQRELFFRCRNSHGEYAHPSFDGKGKGADFNIWAIHLLGYVYGINLATLDD